MTVYAAAILQQRESLSSTLAGFRIIAVAGPQAGPVDLRSGGPSCHGELDRLPESHVCRIRFWALRKAGTLFGRAQYAETIRARNYCNAQEEGAVRNQWARS